MTKVLKYKVFIALIILVLTAIISIGYLVSNNSVHFGFLDKLLLANKTRHEIREAKGSDLNKTIKIGIAGPKQEIEGDTLFYKGIQMAIDEINNDGGILGMKFETVIKDDKNTLSGTLEIAQNFCLDTNVLAVIGHWTSSHTIPVAQLYDETGVLLITPTATEPTLTQKGYKTIFRNTLSDISTAKKMAEYAQQQGYKNIAIYYKDANNGNDLSKYFEEFAKENGINIIDRHSSFVDKEEFDSIYSQWKLKDVDAVFMADDMTDAKAAVAWLKQKDNKLPIISGDDFDATLLKYFGKDSENIAFTTFSDSKQNLELFNEFEKKFKAKFNVEPDYYAIKGYDSIKIISYAVQIAKSTAPSKLEKALKSSKGFQGVNGPISFDENGELNSGDVVIKKVINGEIVNYKEK